ncbi:hypothetical protein MTR_7g083000 [Medicago truncatula]|uniref:Uncharacterized protein n=1 Tax=Medicago truncatula TaxID=3880 RepID=G7KVA7_MEDTR|nr:hypothetical protein MTR_7g083000 [Medicago truncatula]
MQAVVADFLSNSGLELGDDFSGKEGRNLESDFKLLFIRFWKSKPSKIVLQITTQMQLKSTTILLTHCESATIIYPTPQIGVTRTLVEATPSNQPNTACSWSRAVGSLASLKSRFVEKMAKPRR